MDNVLKLKDSAGNELSSESKWNSLIDDFVENVNAGTIVPIIGSGAYSVLGYHSVQEYIVKKLSENLYKKYQISIPADDDLYVGYRGMTKVDRILKRENKDIRIELRDLYKDESFLSKITLKNSVKTFLESGNFPLIITTCNFLRLQSIFPKYSENVIAYQLGQGSNQRIPMNLTKKPCIFHIFGYVQRNTKAVITESHFLNYLSHIKDSQTEPCISTDDPVNNNIIGLKDYLSKEGQEKYLLSIGCDIPDWTFRFLLSSLKVRGGELLYGDPYDNSFSGGALFSNKDVQLNEFLSEIGYFSDDKIESFLEFVNSRLSPRKLPKIFLSVNSEDYQKYGNILKKKLENDYEIWYFPTDGTKRYWESIKKGLKDCQYFIPIVTNTTIVKLDQPREVPEPDKEIGIITEFHMALAEMKTREDKIFSIPYIIETSKAILNNTLKRDSCPNRELFNLFFPGNEMLPMIPIEEFSAEILKNYLKNV